MKRRYIFFEGLIKTLDLYSFEFMRICAAQGAECLVLDAAHMEQEMTRLKAFLLTPVTAVISFNNIGMHLELDGETNLWDHFQIPFFNILMDHPFHYQQAIETAPGQMRLLCMDRNHVEYVKRFFPNVSDVRFFPHAGIETDAKNDAPPLCERPIDVLYAGGLSRYAAEGLIPDLGKITEIDAFALVQSALEQLIQNPHLTTEYVLEQCLQQMGVYWDDKKLGGIIAKLRFVDNFAVSFYREQAVRALTEHGVRVTVFGAGWERVEWQNAHMEYGGQVSPYEILALMKQSKIVLNTMTWFKQGAHDRIFNGMLAKAAVVSDTSEFLLEQFTDGRQIRMFSLKDPYHLVEMVKELLDNPQKAQTMADCGYEQAKACHMWINRLEGAHVYGF